MLFRKIPDSYADIFWGNDDIESSFMSEFLKFSCLPSSQVKWNDKQNDKSTFSRNGDRKQTNKTFHEMLVFLC